MPQGVGSNKERPHYTVRKINTTAGSAYIVGMRDNDRFVPAPSFSGRHYKTRLNAYQAIRRFLYGSAKSQKKIRRGSAV